MKRRIPGYFAVTLVAMLLVLPGGRTHAQTSQPLGEILKKTESFYKNIQAFTATFSQYTTSAAANAMATKATGKLFYQKPRQMRWEYDSPEPQTFVASHQLAWLYAPADRQVSLFDAGTYFASPLAQTFFDGMVELKKHFEVSIDTRQSTKDSAVLTLNPLAEDPNIKMLYLWIDLQSYRIQAVESQDALGNTNRIVLDSFKTMPQLESGLFQLSIPPSTIVVDTEGRELPQSEVDKLKQKLQPKPEGQER